VKVRVQGVEESVCESRAGVIFLEETLECDAEKMSSMSALGGWSMGTGVSRIRLSFAGTACDGLGGVDRVVEDLSHGGKTLVDEFRH
jgi:hypothetical protein